MTTSLIAAPSVAQPVTRFYVGADYQHTKVSYTDVAPGVNGSDFFSDQLSGGHFHAGVKLAPNFGTEIGYLWIPGTETTVTGGTTTIDVNGVTLDSLA